LLVLPPFTIASLIEQGYRLLNDISDSPKLDAQILLCFVIDKPASFLLTWPENILTAANIEQYQALLLRRQQSEPIAYIVGVREFWSLPFYVSPATLIPRPDTETLIELVLDLYQQPCFSKSYVDNNSLAIDDLSAQDNISCLDLGTGTGAIALSLASEMPLWDIHAIDFNIDAVKLAQRNAKNLALTQVNIYQSDWFSQICVDKKFNVIVSNPPYIDEDDIHLSQGDVQFEPKSALVAQDNGLADIRHIAKQARSYLTDNGSLFFEHGYQQAEDVQNILMELGYIKAHTVKDLSGNDRITWARFMH
jgi:release factor glutamine methyltransferase